jgi:hypothetical protein
MRRAPLRRWAGPLAVAAALAGAGCAKGIGGTMLPNAHPVVELSQAPANASSRFFYAYEFKWFGYDSDGEVDYFIYAIDPPTAAGAETTWISTRKYSQILEFYAGTADTIGPITRSIDYHTFVIKAVDNRGLASAPEVRGFIASTVAPFVQITSPSPTALAVVRTSPTVRITWAGDDPDGIRSEVPVGYKWKLLSSSSEFPISAVLLDPASLRRFYAPDFAGWDSVDANTNSVQLSNLSPGATYVFAIIGIDEAGAYSPIFSFNSNLLRFRPEVATTLGPRITFDTPFFSFTYPSGGYSLDPSREIALDLLPGRTTQIRWGAIPTAGTALRGYRWKLGGDVGDETPRADDTDISRWSGWSLLTTTTRVGPFQSGETQRFYLEAEDDNGNRSLGILRIQALNLTGAFNRDLLIVDDTRLAADQRAPSGCTRLPIGGWPMAAELDTFLYARGGVPWRCYPAGTTSSPGLFSRYDFDTAGTRPEVFSFAKLANYRHVIWILDARAALNDDGGFIANELSTSLRYMTAGQGRINALAAYAEAGGKVWLVGGGGAVAARPAFMRDYARWRSQTASVVGAGFIVKSSRVPVNDPRAPSYVTLPARLDPKTSLTDPFPPGRTGQSQGVFYRSVYEFEYMSAANHYDETDPEDPEARIAVLDTLLKITGIGLPTPAQNPENVIMTSYRGSQGGNFIFSGHDLWTYRRAQLNELVDFVLRDLWGLQRRAEPVAATP